MSLVYFSTSHCIWIFFLKRMIVTDACMTSTNIYVMKKVFFHFFNVFTPFSLIDALKARASTVIVLNVDFTSIASNYCISIRLIFMWFFSSVVDA